MPHICSLPGAGPASSRAAHTYFLWKACLQGQIPSSSLGLNSSRQTAQICKSQSEESAATKPFSAHKPSVLTKQLFFPSSLLQKHLSGSCITG